MKFMHNKCKICNGERFSKVYSGKIRNGVWGHFIDNANVFKCNNCKVWFLEEKFCKKNEFYKGVNYRYLLNQKHSLNEYHNNNDYYQNFIFDILPIYEFRNKIVLDFGCGGGSFLDFVNGVAKKCIGIEKSGIFKKKLQMKNYETFSSLEEALNKYRNKIDIIICSAVVEHLEKPLYDLRKVKNLLNKKGTFIISTPNRDDVLMKENIKNFKSFYFRNVHRWYFDYKSLNNLLLLAGFKNNIKYFIHRYSIFNYLNWKKLYVPKGNIKKNNKSKKNIEWKKYLESKKQSDYIFFKSSK